MTQSYQLDHSLPLRLNSATSNEYIQCQLILSQDLYIDWSHVTAYHMQIFNAVQSECICCLQSERDVNSLD